jgi:porphobilinogen synthase
MFKRTRRLRKNDIVRKLVRETRLSAEALVYPLFITEAGTDGSAAKEEIKSMPGQYRYSIDSCYELIENYLSAGIKTFMLFGITDKKDEYGSSAYDENGIVQRALRGIKARYKDLCIITDVCLCEYTSHGHCGIVCNDMVDNDKTIELLARTALSQVQAGADLVAPSDMMDGRVEAIRKLLDRNGYENIPIMSYSAKYASNFYGPFREAAKCSLKGDRKTYQMDYHNSNEAIREVFLDIEEGADIVMVKPCMNYLDIISRVRQEVNVPVAAYSVSGEYAVIKAAALNGWIKEAETVYEMAAAAFRAGADIYITYYAKELAQYIKKIQD